MPKAALGSDNLTLRSATEEAEIGERPFPGARQLVRSIREWFGGSDPELKSDTRYFITSLDGEERSAARLAAAISGRWSVENNNHWTTQPKTHPPVIPGGVSV